MCTMKDRANEGIHGIVHAQDGQLGTRLVQADVSRSMQCGADIPCVTKGTQIIHSQTGTQRYKLYLSLPDSVNLI